MAAEPRVRTMACLGGVSLERDVPTEQIHEYIVDPTNLVWMDMQDPGQAELAMLEEEFGFHPLALEDVVKGRQRPKVDEYKGYVFVVTYAVIPSEDPAEPHTVEVFLFIGRNYVVTCHRGRVPALEDAFGRWDRGGALLREGVGFLTYSVMDSIIDAYFPIITGIEDEVEELEIGMFSRLRPEGVQKLLKLKRTLVTLRRVLLPLRETFHIFLRRDQPMFSAATQVYFHDVYDHVLRLLDALEQERDMVSGALEAYMTVQANRLNATMKTLTLLTACVAVAGSVFGAFGMNFTPVPLGQTAWGFWVVLAITIAAIGLLLLASWRRNGL